MGMTNEELDEKVRILILAGAARTASGIAAAAGADYRAVDRSLQRLRKKKQIEYFGPAREWRPIK